MEGNENENSRNVCSVNDDDLLQKQHLLNDYLQGTINLHVITNFFLILTMALTVAYASSL